MITITEVLGKAAQGRTEPFICRGDDGQLYYVKGRNAGFISLCCEWVAGSLARHIAARVSGFALPEFTIAEVPQALVTQSDRDDIRHLGAGPVFASLKVDRAREITWEDARKLTPNVMAGVLFIDHWLQNDDRTLSDLGGNPNLLITHESEIRNGETSGNMVPYLWVIDFNLAFDPLFTRSFFLDNHVFAGLLKAWPPGFQEAVMQSLPAVLETVPRLFRELPDEWLYQDGDDSLPVHLSQNDVLEMLQLPLQEPEAFWKLP